MTRIHLDTDLGGDIDDLCALAMLLRWPAAEITGVTTVAEDGGRRAGYARYALALAGRADIPVAAGADAAYGPYRHPIPALFPREDRYWPAPVPRAPTPVADALALLKRSVEGGRASWPPAPTPIWPCSTPPIPASCGVPRST